MFIRKKYKKDKKTSKQYCVYQLIESVRTDRGPRQRILLHLGSNFDLSDQDLKALANRIEELVSGASSFINYSDDIEQLAQLFSKQLIKKEALNISEISDDIKKSDYQTVDINSLAHEHSRSIGTEFIAYETLKKLKIDIKLYELGLSKRQVEICIGVIIGKLVYPNSERATYNWLKNHSAIDELMGTSFNKLSLDSVYNVGDLLLKHKNSIEQHLTLKEQDLFSFENTIVLYDLTNTFFEGRAESNSLAKRGHSKEKRSDCPLVTLGLVLNKHGFPIKSKVLPGNISEPSTLQEALNGLYSNISNNPIIVIDAGIATKENLDYLRSKNFRYIVASRKRSCELPKDLDLTIVKIKGDNIVKAKKLSKNEFGEIELICHSSACEKKENSMQTNLQKRFEEDLRKVQESLKKKRGAKLYPKILQKIGRLKEKHKKISFYYKIDIKTDEEKQKVIAINWTQEDEKLSNRFQGAYLLKAYGLDWSEKDLWNTYIMLTKVEHSFRCLKSELGFRPVFHKIDRRVEAHLFISVISYHIMQTILYQLKLADISISFKTLRDNMISQTRVTTSVKLKDGRQLHIRSNTVAEPFHKKIYKALNLSSKINNLEKTFI